MLHDFECVNQLWKYFSQSRISPLVIYCEPSSSNHFYVLCMYGQRLKLIRTLLTALFSPSIFLSFGLFFSRFLVTSIQWTIQNLSLFIFSSPQYGIWNRLIQGGSLCILTKRYSWDWPIVSNCYPIVGSLWKEIVWKCKKHKEIIVIDHMCVCVLVCSAHAHFYICVAARTGKGLFG